MAAVDARSRLLSSPRTRAGHALQPLLERLASAAPAVYEHALGVERLAIEAGRLVGMGERGLAALRLGAMMHDVGKLEVPDSILAKPGPLTLEEWVRVREHPAIGVRILSPIVRSRELLAVVLLHHERWDGKGYPHRLVGTDTPLTARIVAVADAFQAMIEPRPYRAALTPGEALEELEVNAGRQFDPACVEAVGTALRSEAGRAEL